jgi:hypothetical protein
MGFLGSPEGMAIDVETKRPKAHTTINKFVIEVYSDTLCPWSYIGKKNLDLAITDYKKSHPKAEFEVVFLPFYLYPDARVSGRSSIPQTAGVLGRTVVLCRFCGSELQGKTRPFGPKKQCHESLVNGSEIQWFLNLHSFKFLHFS